MRFQAHLHGIPLVLALSVTQAAPQEWCSEVAVEPLSAFDTYSVSRPLLDPSEWSDCGMRLEPVYIGEVFSNTRGGIKRGTRYEALLDLPVTLDFQKMQLPLPGRFFLLGQNTHGRGLTQDLVGDAQVVSNIDSFDNVMQVSEYWWEFDLFNDDVVIRLGKQDLNTEFLLMPSASDFIHSSFGLSPSAGLPSYPAPSMAAVMLAELGETLQLKVGIWDGLADGGSWGFSGNDVTLNIAELEYKYALAGGSLPGVLDLGIAYASAGDVTGQRFPSAYGYYIQLEQLVFRESSCEESNEGLGIFCSTFPRFFNGDFPISVIQSNFVLGLVYTGLISGRDNDVAGVGVAWARLDQGGTNQETAVEAFYKARITPSLSIQPDVQYIATPSGIHPDALVFGMRFQKDY